MDRFGDSGPPFMLTPADRYRQTSLHDNSSAIMNSIPHDNTCISAKSSLGNMTSLLPDLTNQFRTLDFTSPDDSHDKGFLLIDGKEHLKVSSAEQFVCRLGCNKETRAKVVSIFGNTGDGKSFTLNNTFFGGHEVFRTSSEQDSCTMGVWAAYDPQLGVVCLDTEGMLGVTTHENQRTRLLLKVLAVSDIVIYRTRSERLHSDMYTFLGSASRAYSHHFQTALQSVWERGEFDGPLSALGPSVVVFHETTNTDPLPTNRMESAEDILRKRFEDLKCKIDAFSSLRYVGVKTSCPPTNFSTLQSAVESELDNTTVRSARQPHVIYQTLKVLNEKFSGEIENKMTLLFPDQYFTCPVVCLSCDRRCSGSMGHLREGVEHYLEAKCRYQHQFENCTYICKSCHNSGREQRVVPRLTSSSDTSWLGLARFAWSGYVIECPRCGEIYRSRQHWYGNKNPEDSAVRKEIQHVWPGRNVPLSSSQNAAQRVLDGVTYISEAVSSVSVPPTRVLSSWVADQIAPKYWKPNNQIKHCHNCKELFPLTATKHHCRLCGEGFCEDCSSKTAVVPDRGWHSPVRVCDTCYNHLSVQNSAEPAEVDDTEVRARKYGEVVVNTISSVASVLEYPRELIKDTARPSYWVPDHMVTSCSCCDVQFGPKVTLHHCRDCGRCVCQNCSSGRRPVPQRGWDAPVRVCDQCLKQD
ncbi:zinc finger FYVE domain-containing protein 1-like isoform X2 [Bacillus rossius redtenbacheri]|uniref:zinc finger FYVE domain-containing protein 1-like isoform X2 n=1 Tax=Bacillus rossius redtenbacheri TaxID=93214 RepID=UPI002FDE47D1